MRNYFDAEMRLLHETAQHFAKSYPEQAAQLNLESLRDRDPNVERLLEGVAFLTAQIKQRIDDDLPDISASLLSQLWPQVLRPFPSVTIMQFKSRSGQLQLSHLIPAQTITHSNPVGDEKTVCKFSTVAPIKIQPLQIIGVESAESSGKNGCLRILFQFDTGAQLEKLDLSKLTIYLHTDISQALELYYLLTAQVDSVRIIFPQTPLQAAVKLGGQNCITAAQLDDDNHLIPQSGRCFRGFQLLLDYFNYREKFLFISLHGLEKISWSKQFTQFIVEISINHLFSTVTQLSKKNFQLNCVPAVNLYAMHSEPVQLSHSRHEYPLIIDRHHHTSIALFNVDKVSSRDMVSGVQKEYSLLHTFQHRKIKSAFYDVKYRCYGSDDLMPYVMISELEQKSREVLSCAVTVCNKHYPRQYIPENTQHSMSNNTLFVATNITRPTQFLIPCGSGDWQWQLVSLLSLSYQSLCDLSVLKRLLQLYAWPENIELKNKINAIKKLQVSFETQVQRGIMIRIVMMNISLHEKEFSSYDDIYLFGSVMQQFLKMYVGINHKMQLHIVCEPSQREFDWKMCEGMGLPI